jgi:3-oxoacyl-[acyl-carrier-protein] synthase II
MKKRVVVTGIGLLTPVGEGKEETWSNMISGVSGVDEIRYIDTTDFRTHRGAEVKNFKFGKYSDNKKPIGKASMFAIACGAMALEDARLDLAGVDPGKVGVCLGTTMGEIQVMEGYNDQFFSGGNGAHNLSNYSCHNIALNVAENFGLEGPCYVINTACAAGIYSIGYAFDCIRNGESDIILSGGVDVFSRVALTGFNRLLASSPDFCRPFAKNRKGMIIGEGAAVLVLESEEHALKRGADIICEVSGYGTACDAYHMTAPHREGAGGIAAIKKALKGSGKRIEDIDFISAHGTGTPANDKIETNIIKKVFGEKAYEIPITAIKSMIGHTFGAASAIEAAICAMVINRGVIPPTINYDEKDPDCDLNYVTNVKKEKKVNITLSNAFAFGGNTAALILEQYAPGKSKSAGQKKGGENEKGSNNIYGGNYSSW